MTELRTPINLTPERMALVRAIPCTFVNSFSIHIVSDGVVKICLWEGEDLRSAFATNFGGAVALAHLILTNFEPSATRPGDLS